MSKDAPDLESIPDVVGLVKNNNDSSQKTLSTLAQVRIKRDIMQLFNDPISGIIICPDDDDITLVYALITGLFDTPYEGGLFVFSVKFPVEYPSYPPKVKFLTTGRGKVRFNPNWYENGTVCVSILGTWSGPGWTPAQTLSSVLLSIQSLMNPKPYHNEPGYEKEKRAGDVDKYNKCIEHETIRVAVCGLLEGQSGFIPYQIKKLSKSLFMEYYDHYVSLCEERLHLDGKQLQDPFERNHGVFKYGELIIKLKKLHDEIEKEQQSEASSS